MRVQVAIPEAHVDAPVLDAALEATTRLNEAMLRKGEVPTFDDGLKEGIRWQPEPPGAEHFDHAREVLKRGWGDCDDLAPWHAASLRHTGEDPEAKAIVRKSGPHRWHAIVQRHDGSIEDPSKAAGMGRHVAIHGAAVPLMYPAPSSSVVGGVYVVRPAIAMRPVRGNWQARADLPWMRPSGGDERPTATDYAMVSLHQDPVASTALTGAIDGACLIGQIAGFADPEHINRLCAISDCIEGASFDELVGVYGEEHARAATELVGSFFKKLGKVAKGIAKTTLKIARPLIKYVPGIGPLASDAVDLIEKASAMMNIPKDEMAKLLQHAQVFPSLPDAEVHGHGAHCRTGG